MKVKEEFFFLEGVSKWDEGPLAHGIVCHLPERDGALQLERTGPYVPDLTIPSFSKALVTTAGKEWLQANGFKGLVFTKRVEYANVIELNWQDWNDRIPKSYEFTVFSKLLMDKSLHREDLSLQMPQLFEVNSQYEAVVTTHPEGCELELTNYSGEYLFNGNSEISCEPIVSSQGREILKRKFGGILNFRKVELDEEDNDVIVLKSRWTEEEFMNLKKPED